MAATMMRRSLSLLVAMPAALAGASTGGCALEPAESPTRGRLTAVVCESHAGLLSREADVFNSLYPDARVSVRPASTREAFVALLADSVSFVVVDRSPNAEELGAIHTSRLDLKEVRIAHDALGLFVNRANGLAAVTREQADGLLAGRIDDWSALPEAGFDGPVQLALTGRNSGAYELLTGRFFPDAAPAPTLPATTQDEVLAAVAREPRAIGVASVAAWKAAEKALDDSAGAPPTDAGERAGWADGAAGGAGSPWRALAVSAPDSEGAVAPRRLHQANVHAGLYPLHYPIYAYFNRRSRLAMGFSTFIASAPGQKMILDAGLVPATMPVRLVHLR